MRVFIEILFLCSTLMCYEWGELHTGLWIQRNLMRLLWNSHLWLNSCLGRNVFSFLSDQGKYILCEQRTDKLCLIEAALTYNIYNTNIYCNIISNHLSPSCEIMYVCPLISNLATWLRRPTLPSLWEDCTSLPILCKIGFVSSWCE